VWTTTDIERAGHQWMTSREMTLAPSRLPVAVIVIQGQSNPRRERAALEGWRTSIVCGQYAQVRYVAGPSPTRHLTRVATEIGLSAPQFIVGETVMADEPPVQPSTIESHDEELVGVTAGPVRIESAPIALLISRGLQRRPLSHSAQAPQSP
jgi:hypothetical protein